MTDSVIFIQPRDEPQLVEAGDSLGDMTSELKPHETIAEFVSGGSKNYAYTIIDTRNAANQTKKTVCKVRSITLNYASQLVNVDVIKDMILDQETSYRVTVHTEHKIKRKRNLREGIVSIITEPEDKIYSVIFEMKTVAR